MYYNTQYFTHIDMDKQTEYDIKIWLQAKSLENLTIYDYWNNISTCNKCDFSDSKLSWQRQIQVKIAFRILLSCETSIEN